jgi:hypothetical protein
VPRAAFSASQVSFVFMTQTSNIIDPIIEQRQGFIFVRLEMIDSSSYTFNKKTDNQSSHRQTILGRSCSVYSHDEPAPLSSK